MSLQKLQNSLLQLAAVVLMIILIIDIQDKSFDTPVIVLHYLHVWIGYINNLKISNTVFDVLVLQSVLNILNIYLFNFKFSLLFLSILVIRFWISGLSLPENVSFTLFAILPKLTFSKFQKSISKAFIRIP